MDESGTWKQIVLLIGCVTVCHRRHLHLWGGKLACRCLVIDNLRLLSRVPGFITWIEHLSFTQGANQNEGWSKVDMDEIPHSDLSRNCRLQTTVR